MSKNYRANIETAKKKYAQIRELYDVLSNCANLEIDGSPLLERREPTLTEYQRAENVVERHTRLSPSKYFNPKYIQYFNLKYIQYFKLKCY